MPRSRPGRSPVRCSANRGKTEMTEPMESRADILISRMIDGRARADDLRELSELAAADVSIWKQLAAADSDREALALAVESTIGVADRIEAPAPTPESHDGPYRLNAWTGWMGWAAAAAVVFAWAMFSQMPLPGAGTTEPAPIQPVALSADDALQRYIEARKAEDRFIRELPKVMVDSRKTADGTGTEITYMRQFLEKTVVSDLYEVGTDEHGRPGAVRVNSPVGSRSTLY